VKVPTVLVHGERDTESRPEIAQRLHALIPGSQLHLLRGFDHYTILTDGRHQVTHLLAGMLDALE
jgi:pimeloyl-ACP methyl ester carboxylesterase